MIRVILQGRIGNQMFQYAAGRHLSIRHKARLVLDRSRYALRRQHVYGLYRFPIVARTPNPFPSVAFTRLFGKQPWKLTGATIHYERNHCFDNSVLQLPDSTVLVGRFQSEKYFQPVSDHIRKDFDFEALRPAEPPSEIEREIRDSNSVSVHVRRGDYLTRARYRVCTLEYYRRAMNHMRSRLDHPTFFVFSDELDWCIQNFCDPDCRFGDPRRRSGDNCHDMRLMSLCRHSIIANSSYSWWGAWLNRHPHKTVICPQIWFRADHVPIEDKMCDGWITMPV